MTPSLAQTTFEMLREHIAKEDVHLAAMEEQLTKASIVQARLLEKADRSSESHAAMLLAINKLDGGHTNHEARLTELERTVKQAAILAKWFFGGGLIATATSLYLFWNMIHDLGSVLTTLK